MIRRIASGAQVTVLLVALSTCTFNLAVAEGLRRFQVRDSIEMARFVEPAMASPDERYIATVTERGLIEQNATEGTIWLFDAGAVSQAINHSRGAGVKPVPLVQMSATVNGGPIVNRMIWESDSKSLLFLGRNSSENRQLYRVNLLDQKLTVLSLPTQDVVDFTVSGKRVVYLAGPGLAPETAWWSNDPGVPDIVVGVHQSIWETLYPNYRRNTRYMPTEFELWQTGEMTAPVVDATTKKPMRLLASYNLDAMGLSHDGSKVVLLSHVARVPKLWESYEVPKDLDTWPYRSTPDGTVASLNERENDYAWPLQYQLIDLQGGTQRALIESPAADFQRLLVDQLQVAWSADDSAVAVTGTFMPLGPGTHGLKRPCGTAVIRFSEGHVDCLIDHDDSGAKPVTSVTWDGSNNRLLVKSGTLEAFQYDQRSQSWKLRSRHAKVGMPAVELAIQQDLNTPPVLTAHDRQSVEVPRFSIPIRNSRTSPSVMCLFIHGRARVASRLRGSR